MPSWSPTRSTRSGRRTRPSCTTSSSRMRSSGPRSLCSGSRTARGECARGEETRWIVAGGGGKQLTHRLALPCRAHRRRSSLPPRPAGKNYEQHRLLLGTHTSGQDQNYVQIAQLQLPTTAAIPTAAAGQDGEEAALDTTKYDEDKGGALRAAASAKLAGDEGKQIHWHSPIVCNGAPGLPAPLPASPTRNRVLRRLHASRLCQPANQPRRRSKSSTLLPAESRLTRHAHSHGPHIHL